MRRSDIAVAAIALAALAGCKMLPAANPVADTAKVAEAVKADVAGLLAAYNAHDAAKAASYDAPGYVSMFHGGPNAVGPAADEAAMKQQMTDPAVRFEVRDAVVEVAASGDLAVYRAAYTYHYTDPKTKGAASESGNWVAAFRRQADGSMKLAWSIGADTGPPPPSG